MSPRSVNARAHAPGDHAELHRRQVLRLVHDDVSVGSRRLDEQRAGQVQERHVGARPAAGAAGEHPLLAVVEQVAGRLLEPRSVPEQLGDDDVRLDDGPDTIDEAGEPCLAERALDLVGRGKRAGAELRRVLAVQVAQELHAEALARGVPHAEPAAHHEEQRLDLVFAHADVGAVEPRLEGTGPRLEPELDGAPHDLGQTEVGLETFDVGPVGARHLDAVDELGDGALVDALLPEDRKDVRDVVHEGGVRADDEDPPQLLAVRVEQERGAVQPDGRLAGARPALNDERRRRVARDEPVLVGLDRRDDVAHVRVAAALELLEQEVVDRGRAFRERAIERLVVDVEHFAAARAEAPPQRHAVGGDRRGGVERTGRRRLPVHDDDVVAVVVHPAATDVERGRRAVDVHAPEAEPTLRVGEGDEPPRRPRLERLLRNLSRAGRGRALQRLAHAVEARVRVVDVGLFQREVRMRHGRQR